MPRATKRPHLWLRKARIGTDGIAREAGWIIIDGSKHIATGCLQGEAEGADRKLAAYIAQKYQPQRAARPLEAIDVADVLSIYVDDTHQTGRQFLGRMARLNEFWGGKTLADVTDTTCRQYEDLRGRAPARREIEDLRSAIKHHAKKGFHRELVLLTLPAKGRPRDRWLTRQEAAKLLWTCWRAREHQDGQPTKKRPLRHLARFILIGLYTGTRAGAIATASTEQKEGRSYVDLDRGIFYRLAIGKAATNKRQTPVRLPPRLLSHMRRWKRLGIAREHFVEFNGKAVASVKTAFKSAAAKAGIDNVSPHVLRHTAATWMMQNSAPIWQAAGFLGMSEKVLRDVYGHHSPDHMSEAVKAVTAKQPLTKTLQLVGSLVEARERRDRARLSL